jgi:ribonucleoside-diphosphate reductase alpha chain
VADGKHWQSGDQGFFSRGIKPVIILQTQEGYGLRLTSDHRLRKVTRRTRWSCEWEWAEAGSLRTDDELLLHDHREAPAWGPAGEKEEAEGYLLGLLLGDGVLKADKAVLSVWPEAATANGNDERPGIRGVMEAALAAARCLPHRADFQGWVCVPGRGEYRLSLASLKKLALDHGLAPGAKKITDALEQRSSAFCAALLRGLFDSDGSIQGRQEKGVSVRLAQSDAALLEAAQRMLLRLGIVSTLYRNRRPARQTLLPDGRGGRKHYDTAAQHELIVSGENLALFAARVGFADTAKTARLRASLSSYRRRLNHEPFVATVAAIAPDGEAEVFDAPSLASTLSMPTACGRIIAANSHFRLTAPACWDRSTWPGW